jgi:hypothetical protein
MSAEAGIPDAQVGYATKLAEGWQVLDVEFKPVNDVHVVTAVENQIKEEYPTA